jgi:hypothetical protein
MFSSKKCLAMKMFSFIKAICLAVKMCFYSNGMFGCENVSFKRNVWPCQAPEQLRPATGVTSDITIAPNSFQTKADLKENQKNKNKKADLKEKEDENRKKEKNQKTSDGFASKTLFQTFHFQNLRLHLCIMDHR